MQGMSKLCCQQGRTIVGIEKEIERLVNWAIATNPRRGTIKRGDRTRKKIYTLIAYWTLKVEGGKNAIG